MSKLKHTPGPWTIIKTSSGFRGLRIFAGNHYIASVGNSDDDLETSESDARLIASAPELLDIIIKTYIADLESPVNQSWLDALRVLIEKATGMISEEVINDRTTGDSKFN